MLQDVAVMRYQIFSCCWFQPENIWVNFLLQNNWKQRNSTLTYKQTKHKSTHTKMLSLRRRIIKIKQSMIKKELLKSSHSAHWDIFVFVGRNF